MERATQSWIVRAMGAVLFLCLSHAASSATLVDLRVRLHPDFTRVIFETDEPVAYRIERIEPTPSGDREIVVTLAAQSGPRVGKSPRDGATRVTVTPLPDGRAEARIRVQGPVRIEEEALDHPARIVLDLRAAAESAVAPATATWRVPAETGAGSVADAPPPVSGAPEPSERFPWLVPAGIGLLLGLALAWIASRTGSADRRIFGRRASAAPTASAPAATGASAAGPLPEAASRALERALLEMAERDARVAVRSEPPAEATPTTTAPERPPPDAASAVASAPAPAADPNLVADLFAMLQRLDRRLAAVEISLDEAARVRSRRDAIADRQAEELRAQRVALARLQRRSDPEPDGRSRSH